MILDRIKHIFGIHKYYEIMRLSCSCHLLGCRFCNKKFALSTSAKVILDWDLEIEDFHRERGHIK